MRGKPTHTLDRRNIEHIIQHANATRDLSVDHLTQVKTDKGRINGSCNRTDCPEAEEHD